MTIPSSAHFLLRLLHLTVACWHTEGPWMSLCLQMGLLQGFPIFRTASGRQKSLGSLSGLPSLRSGHLLSDLLFPRGTLGRLSPHPGSRWERSSLQNHSFLCSGCNPPSIDRILLLCCLSGTRVLFLDVLSELLTCFPDCLQLPEIYAVFPILHSWLRALEWQVADVHSVLICWGICCHNCLDQGSMNQLWLWQEWPSPKQGFSCFLSELE